MSTTSYKVSDGLWLVHQGVAKKAAAKPADVPVHHVAVIDCSGSMGWDLPQIREQLKRKLPKLLREKDTFSLIWFSGRDEYGVLFQGEPVATLADLKTVEQAIDRWLKPVGLTGFKQPLETVATVAAKLRSSGPKDAAVALFFLSDGCDNQWSRGDVLKAMEKAAGAVSSVTVVEYGYYAGRDLLADMTAKAGGTHIFAETFDKYVPSFEAAMQRRLTGAPRVEAKVAGDPVCGLAFSMGDGEITAYEASGGSVLVPEDLSGFWYLSPAPAGASGKADLQSLSKAAWSLAGAAPEAVDAAYAAVSLLSVRMKPDTVLPLLKGLGDVKMIQAFGGCFGKQKYSEFVDLSKDAAFGRGRFEQGWDPSKVPADDAFTVLDLIRIISEDDGNRVLFDDPSFKYSPIGRGRVDSSTVLTAKEQKEVAELSAELAKTKDPAKLKEINARIAAITATKGEALKFEEAAKEAGDEGYPVSSLTYNEDRPNVSVLVRKEGTVNLASRLPAALKGTKVGSGVPETFSTFIFRNYTIIKDGLVNVKQLPVALTLDTVKKLEGAGCPADVRIGKAEQSGSRFKITIDLSKLPIINRRMVKEVSARTLFETEWELTKARAAQKVYNAFKKDMGESKKSATFDALYGADGAAWLKEQGFTDYSGFSPKSVLAEAKDVYKAKELKVSLKGYSSFPTLAKYREAVQKGKLNGPAELMKPYVDEVDAFLASDVYKKAADQGALFTAWIEPKAKDATAKVRSLLSAMAEIKFSIVVGQVWPKEFKSLEENSMDLTLDGKLLSFKVEQNEKDEPI